MCIRDRGRARAIHCTISSTIRLTVEDSPPSEKNQTRYITVTADTLDGYNTTVQSRVLQRCV